MWRECPQLGHQGQAWVPGTRPPAGSPTARPHRDRSTHRSTGLIRRGRAAPQGPPGSVRANLTRVQSPLLGVPVHPLEVFEAWGTAEPRLPKVHVAGEEKVAMPWPHATLQQRPDTPLPVAVALGRRLEDPALLPIESAHAQVDGRVLPLGLVGDFLDGASNGCAGKEMETGSERAYSKATAPPPGPASSGTGTDS